MCAIGVVFSVDVFYARKNKKLRKEKSRDERITLSPFSHDYSKISN